MPLIKRVQIERLNGQRDVDLQISGRHCIIVGPNGSGKSTALQVLAYALGRQWKTLGSIRFEKLHIHFSDGKTASISRESCERFGLSNTRGPSFGRIQRELIDIGLLETFISIDLSKMGSLEEYSSILRIPHKDVLMTQRYLRRTTADKEAQSEVIDFQSILTEANTPSTLYLPTYRRIELELKKNDGECSRLLQIRHNPQHINRHPN